MLLFTCPSAVRKDSLKMMFPKWHEESGTVSCQGTHLGGETLLFRLSERLKKVKKGEFMLLGELIFFFMLRYDTVAGANSEF